MSSSRELRSLEAALRGGGTQGLAIADSLAEIAARLGQAEREQAAARGRVVLLRDWAARLAREEGLPAVAAGTLDAVIATVSARRGFLGVGGAGSWRIVASRDSAGRDVEHAEEALSRSVIEDVLRSGQSRRLDDAAATQVSPSALALRLRSVACLPVAADGAVLGFVYLDDTTTAGLFDEAALEEVRAWLPFLSACLARAAGAEPASGLPGVLTRSSAMLGVLGELRRVARFDASILLTGETGTGKSTIARAVHSVSPRAAGPFVHVNCGAIPEGLVEGEIFGAEAGAYTGARVRRTGKLEAAAGGTIFLDELDAMPVSAQVKLLVALQERRVTPLGGNRSVPVDVRVIAAMSSEPSDAVARGLLREELYYRLAVYTGRVPPLRERMEDVPLLARHILARASERYRLPSIRLSEAAQGELLRHDWPGNVRELENVLDRAALLAGDGLVASLAAGIGGPRGAEGGVVGRLVGAATAFANRLIGDPSLADVDLGVMEGAVLLALGKRLGTRTEALQRVGRAGDVVARNHARTWAREVGRLRALAERLGETPPGDPTEG